MLWRKRPNWKTLAGSYESALRVKRCKNIWMVEYLRARRSGDNLRGFFRRRFLADKTP
jgi:hypothetical protein